MIDSMKIGNKVFDFKHHTYVMGILNVTPDSFSDGGKWNQLDAAKKCAEQMIKDGVDIIDVGGESTRPGYERISDEEEIKRVLPVIQGIKEEFDIPVSIDTYKSAVARAATWMGADLINDIWGLKADDEMARVVKRSNTCVCLMHNRENMEYQNFMYDVKNDLKESIEIAKSAGISDDKIIIDPGVGFAKTLEMNLAIMNQLEELKGFDYPILLGASRKSVIGLTLDLPVDEREEGTLATTALAVTKGCQFVRVHNVKGNKRFIKMLEAIRNAKVD